MDYASWLKMSWKRITGIEIARITLTRTWRFSTDIVTTKFTQGKRSYDKSPYTEELPDRKRSRAVRCATKHVTTMLERQRKEVVNKASKDKGAPQRP